MVQYIREFKARPCGLVIGPLSGDIHGMSKVTNAIAEKLVKKGFSVEDTGASRKSNSFLYHLLRVWKHGRALLALLTGKYKYVKTIYSVVNDGLGIYYTWSICWAAKIRGSTLYLHHHSWKYNSRFNSSIKTLVKNHPNIIHIFLCTKMRDDFEVNYGPVKSTILSNRSIFYSDRSKLIKNNNKLVVGHISNLSIEKGLNYVLEFARRISDCPKEIELLIAGPGSYKTRSEIRKALDKSHNSKYLGPVYDARKEAFFQEVDVLLFPSSYPTEAEALVLYEAQAYGIFLVTSKFGCSESQVQDGDLIVCDLDSFTDQAEKRCLQLYEYRETLPELRESRQSCFRSLAKNQNKILETLLFEMIG